MISIVMFETCLLVSFRSWDGLQWSNVQLNCAVESAGKVFRTVCGRGSLWSLIDEKVYVQCIPERSGMRRG